MFEGFLSVMHQGGPDMWILLVLSIIVVAIVIERAVFFASQHGDTKGLLKQIGQRFGRDHSSVLHSARLIKNRLPKDPDLAFDVALLIENITGTQS